MEHFGYVYDTDQMMGTFDFGQVKVYKRDHMDRVERHFIPLHPDIIENTENLLSGDRQEFEVTYKYRMISEHTMSAYPIDKYAIPLIKFGRIK